jgi:hypothetical protein
MERTFRVDYDNGFEVVRAKDIFSAAAQLKRAYKRFFKMPISITETTRCSAPVEPREGMDKPYPRHAR